jgi:cytochrome bd-type quinol oxidase subunit 2
MGIRGTRTAFRTLVAVVFLHGAVVVAHSVTHVGAGVWLPLPAMVYIWLIIVIGPFAGLWVARSGRRVAGAALVTACMIGAFFFGYLNHFVWPSIDHVDAISSVVWRPHFRNTAWLLALAEIVGMVVGSVGVWTFVREN